MAARRPGQLVKGSRSELPQLALEVRPPQLDGADIRAEGRQVHHARPHCLDSVAHALGLVRAQVTHQHDVSGSQPVAQSLAHEAQEDAAVDRALVRHELGAAPHANGPQQRQCRPPAAWAYAYDSLPYGAQPYSRVMEVVQNDSSKKTSRHTSTTV